MQIYRDSCNNIRRNVVFHSEQPRTCTCRHLYCAFSRQKHSSVVHLGERSTCGLSVSGENAPLRRCMYLLARFIFVKNMPFKTWVRKSTSKPAQERQIGRIIRYLLHQHAHYTKATNILGVPTPPLKSHPLINCPIR